MVLYAGIDEAGYGPLLGPLVIARAALHVPAAVIGRDPSGLPQVPLWDRLRDAICRSLTERRADGRLPLADSKKLHSQKRGVKHLELGCLAWLACAEQRVPTLEHWLDALGTTCHHDLTRTPWYAPPPVGDLDWPTLPLASTSEELALAAGPLGRAMQREGLTLPPGEALRAAVLLEDRFNRTIDGFASGGKAALAFTFVTSHLLRLWRGLSPEEQALVVVDRQGGRHRYRTPLAQALGDTVQVNILHESEDASGYEVLPLRDEGRRMELWFLTGAEQQHLPVAVASMAAKYTREAMMHRLNHHFGTRIPGLKPTAGYATDGRRWLRDVAPHLPSLGLTPEQLCRLR